MPGIFRADPEKSTLARKPGNIFQSPEVFQNRVKFLHLMSIFTILAEILLNERQNLDRISVVRSMHGFGFGHGFARSLVKARKNNFVKVVTLQRAL